MRNIWQCPFLKPFENPRKIEITNEDFPNAAEQVLH